MGVKNFFSLDNDAPKTKTKEATPDDTKGKEIRKIGGHESIADVAANAPSAVGTPATSGSQSPRGVGAVAPSGKRLTKAEIDEQAKAAERAAARARIGRYWAKRLSNIPYDTWAKILQDNDMRLTDKEAEELAEDLFMTMEAFDIDPTNKWVLLGGLLFTHGAVISTRIEILRKKDAAALAEETVVM